MPTATATATTPARKRRRFTAFTVNIVRLALTALILILAAFLFWEIHSRYSSIDASSKTTAASATEAQKASQFAQRTAEEAKKIAEASQQTVTEIKQEFGDLKVALSDLPEKNGQVIVEAIRTINAKTEAEALKIRGDIVPIQQKIGSVETKASEIATRLTTSEQSIADLKKSALDELARAKASASPQPNPVLAPTGMTSAEAQAGFRGDPPPVPSQQGTQVGGQGLAPSDRHYASLSPQDKPKVFSRWEVENLAVVLAPVRGIHATLIYKSGLLRTWTREVSVIPGEPFDIKGADQVAFWSDVPAWVTWKKR